MRYYLVYGFLLTLTTYILSVSGAFPRWHNLQARLDVKKRAEKHYSPTGKIMVNLLWDPDIIRKDDKIPRILIEADMEVTNGQKKRWTAHGFYFDNQMEAIADPWPKGAIKYRFSKHELVLDKTVVVLAMKEWTARVKCLKFVEDNTSPEKDVLLIVRRKLSFASLGYRSERKQHILSVPEVAEDKSVLLHLLGHVIGLPHFHSRPDRQRFIRFATHNLEMLDVFFLNIREDCPWDYASVMHYDFYAFTMNTNGELAFELTYMPWSTDATVNKVLENGNPYIMDPAFLHFVVGRWEQPSMSDVYRAQHAYGCSETQCFPTGYDMTKLQILPLPVEADAMTNKHSLLVHANVESNDYTFNIQKAKTGYQYDIILSKATELTDDDACHRTLTFFQPAQRPTREQMAYWLLTGCTWLQLDIYDARFDFHDVICGADFARMQRKAIFTSANMRIFIRMHKLDDPIAKTMQDGMASVVGYQDYICSGQATVDPACQGVPNDNKNREFRW